MMEIAGVADFANMEGMLCACMLVHSRYNRQASDVYKVAEQLKELAQQDTYNKIHIVYLFEISLNELYCLYRKVCDMHEPDMHLAH